VAFVPGSSLRGGTKGDALCFFVFFLLVLFSFVLVCFFVGFFFFCVGFFLFGVFGFLGFFFFFCFVLFFVCFFFCVVVNGPALAVAGKEEKTKRACRRGKDDMGSYSHSGDIEGKGMNVDLPVSQSKSRPRGFRGTIEKELSKFLSTSRSQRRTRNSTQGKKGSRYSLLH